MKDMLIITHAGSGIGGGHLSRCRALSDGARSLGIGASWIVNDGAMRMSPSLERAKVADDPFDLSTVQGHRDLIASADMVVVDTYAAGESYFAALRAAGARELAVIADSPSGPWRESATIVIDYGLGRDVSSYADDAAPGRELLIGPRWSLIRSELWDLETGDDGRAIFIAGASDVARASLRAAEIWDAEAPLVIVLGPLAPDELEAGVRDIASRRENISVMRAPSDLPRMMAGAHAVICTASVTMNEALALKKRVAVFTVADNQIGAGAWLAERGLAIDLGQWSGVDGRALSSVMSFEPSLEIDGLVDMRGAVKCAARLAEIADGRRR